MIEKDKPIRGIESPQAEHFMKMTDNAEKYRTHVKATRCVEQWQIKVRVTYGVIGTLWRSGGGTFFTAPFPKYKQHLLVHRVISSV